MCFETECMALQGHPRSLSLAPTESAYATSYWSSIVTLVLSCPDSENCRFSAESSDLTPAIPPEFWGIPLDQIADVVAPGSEDPISYLFVN